MQPNPYYPPPPLPPARPDRTRLWLTLIAIAIVIGIIGLVVEIIVLTRDDNSTSSAATTPHTTSAPTSSSDDPRSDPTPLIKCKEAAADQLKDPDSATFRNIKIVGGLDDGTGWKLTGEVNGKNSYGAYSGYTPFTCLAVKGLSLIHI